jgi:flagellar hook-basal body complex protein FliE
MVGMSINNVTSVRADISQMLDRMREVKGKSPALTSLETAQPSGFGDIMSTMKSAFGEVNYAQQNSEVLKNQFISGDSSVSMSQLIVAAEKSKLAFAGLITVRNKILEAYKDVMNMQV